MERKAGFGLISVFVAVALAQPLKGKLVPAVSLPTVDGKQITIEVAYDKRAKKTFLQVTLRYRSQDKWVRETVPAKALLLDFWASWCGPCMVAIPDLVELHKKYAEKGLVVVGVNLGESRQTVSRVVEGLKIPYFVPLDRGHSTVKPFGIKAIPVFVLVDSKGMVVYTKVGLVPEMRKVLESKIKPLLGLRQ